MGDRGNIVIRQQYGPEGSCLYLYSHGSGSDLPEVLQKALAKRWRWTEEIHLARIIFDQMTEGQNGQEIGFGISTYETDNENPILIVDCKTQTVSSEGHSWTFEEYIALPDPISAVRLESAFGHQTGWAVRKTEHLYLFRGHLRKRRSISHHTP